MLGAGAADGVSGPWAWARDTVMARSKSGFMIYQSRRSDQFSVIRGEEEKRLERRDAESAKQEGVETAIL